MGIFYGISNVNSLSGLGLGIIFIIQEPFHSLIVQRGILPSKWEKDII
jgi:hypothetical protein